MKAVFFEKHGGPEVLRYGEFPDPECRPGWVVVKVAACSLNYLDIFSRRGMPGIKIELPGITGGDCAGQVAELGAGVEGWSVDQRVMLDPVYIDPEARRLYMLGENTPGALAQYCTVHASQLMALPDPVADEHAACLPVAYGTSQRMLVTRGELRAGEKILILGASGGVGTSCVLLAKLLGAHVIAAAGSDEKCAKLQALGADETINYATTDFREYCRQTTGSMMRGGGYDVVINFTGGETWAESMRCVKRRGRLLTCGATAGFDPQTDLRYLWTGELDVRGSNGWTRADLERVLEHVAAGRLTPAIDTVLPLSRGIEACQQLEDRRFFGKIVVRPWQED